MRYFSAKVGLAFALALTVAGAPYRAGAQTLGLADVVKAAATASPMVKREDEKVLLASGQLQQAEGAFDWFATGEAGWERFYVAKVRNGFLSDDLDTAGVYHTTLGVQHTFYNGITVQPGVSLYANSSISSAQTLGQTEPKPSLNLTVPILRGLGENGPLAANERAAENNLDGSRYGRDFIAQRALVEAVQLYWHCVGARDSLAIASSDQQASTDFVASLRALVAQGRIEPTTLDRAIANQAVERISSSKAGMDDERCRRDLAVATGLPTGFLAAVTGDFPAPDILAAQVAKLNDKALADLALQKRQDLRALERYEAAQAEKLKAAEDGQRPKLDLYLDPNKVLLRLTKSLGGDVEHGQLSAAEAAHNQARIDLEQLRAQIQRDIADIRQSLSQALANWTDLNQSAMLLQGVVASGEQQRQAATITQQEYRAMQRELADIRRQMIDAKVQFAFGLAQLRLATGTIETGAGVPSENIAALFRSVPNT